MANFWQLIWLFLSISLLAKVLKFLDHVTFFNNFSFTYSTTLCVKYYCSKLWKTALKNALASIPPPRVIVPVYVEFTDVLLRVIWVSEFQTPLYSISNYMDVWISDTLIFYLPAIWVSEFQTPLYSIACCIGVWISDTLILYYIVSYIAVWISDMLIFYFELYGCLKFRHPYILLHVI
jgi:hypothetical protein